MSLAAQIDALLSDNDPTAVMLAVNRAWLARYYPAAQFASLVADAGDSAAPQVTVVVSACEPVFAGGTGLRHRA
jgi:hypothetical protein